MDLVLLDGPKRRRRPRIGPFRFGTDAAAPLPSPYTEPAARGSLAIVDTGFHASISSGAFQWATSVGAADPAAYSTTTFARKTGRALLARMQHLAAGNPSRSYVAWDTDAAAFPNEGVRFDAGTLRAKVGADEPVCGALSEGLYDTGYVQRSSGGFHLIRAVGESVWQLYYVSIGQTNTPMYVGVVVPTSNAKGFVDNLRVVDLPGVWRDDDGPATQVLSGARSAGDTYTHTADALIERIITTRPSAGSIVERFREQDDTNHWSIQVNSAGDLSLVETVAGAPTTRGSSAAVIVNGNRVMVIADDVVMRVYSSNVLRYTYSSATNFKAATAGRLASLGTGGAVSTIKAWPRRVSLPGWA